MKKIARIISLLSMIVMVAAPLVAHAADKKAKSEIVMKVGNKVHLFHSSNVEAQRKSLSATYFPCTV